MHTKEVLDKALSVAKIDMMKMKNTVFVSTVMCSLDAFYDDKVPTAATNGKYIRINPHFFMALPPTQRVFLLAHETMHVVYTHMLRRGARDHEKFNIAADYVINYELVQQGLEFIPIGLYDEKYRGMSTEEVYDLLPDTLPNNGMGGDIEEPDNEEEAVDVQSDVENIISRATQLADMRGAGGSVPESVRRMLINMTEPKVNWRHVTRKFFTTLDKHNYTWSRPNRRYQEFYLPSVRKDVSLDKITFALDASCSVTNNQFDQFISEILAVFKTLKPKVIELMQFDHLLQSVEDVKSLNQLLSVEFKGRGGTRPIVAIEAFMKSRDSKALIVITDGEFGTNLPKPKQPVVWVIFNNPRFKAPYGKVIHVDIPR